jgi:hypothetical protein
MVRGTAALVGRMLMQTEQFLTPSEAFPSLQRAALIFVEFYPLAEPACHVT